MYSKLGDITNEEELQAFESELTDRFGPLPKEAIDLLNSVRIKWIANAMGIEKVIIKQNKMIGYFIADQQSEFYQTQRFTRVMQLIQENSKLCQIKEKQTRNGLRLLVTFNQITSIKKAINALSIFEELLPEVEKKAESV